MSRERTVIKMVLMMAGIMETFSELYSHANRLGVRWGMPFTRI